MLTREEAVRLMRSARLDRKVTIAQVAETIGRHPVWTAAALHGQASLSADETAKLAGVLGMEAPSLAVLQQPPNKGALGQTVPTDPLIYRFYEIMQVYGPALKDVIHEQFGDGIMSAIDFEIDIRKQPDPKGDRVVVTFNGKFLPYRKW
jgi:cyanate lyase